MSKITVIGSFSMDMTITMDQFPQEGQTLIGKKLVKSPGGKGANQCIACARLGGDVEMIGMLGNDENGTWIKNLFENEKVNIEHVLFTDKEPTTIALIEINGQGQNKIVVVPAANFVYSVEDLMNVKEVISKTELVIAQLEMDFSVTEALIQLCDEMNVPLLLNPAPAVEIRDELLGKVTYLTPNETELSILSGMPTDNIENCKKAAQSLISRGVKNVIATLGKEGALLATQNEMKIIKGFAVKAVDTVAAGDSFNGAFAYALISGKNQEEAIEFANAVGALTVMKQGAINSLPTLKEVQNFLIERGIA